MSLNTREKIKKSVLRNLKKTSHEKIKVNQIVKEVKISRSTFYRLFNSIDDVIDELEIGFFEEIRNVNRYYLSSKLERKFDTYNQYTYETLKCVLKHKELFSILSSKNGREEFATRAKGLIKEFYTARLGCENVQIENRDLYVEFAINGHYQALIYWTSQENMVPPEKMALVLEKMMFSAIISNDK